ncbi:MAG TPA: endopeptidase La [Nitrospirota bacterium]|nr:endopeptidase La [Nitrospirota bacterium]
MKFFKSSNDDQQEVIIEDLRKKVSLAKMPAAVQRIAEQELAVLSKINQSAAEYTIGVTYIDYLISLPWNLKTEDNLDIPRAEHILNENHFGLNRIKERVMEHLAVKVLMTNRKPRVLVVDDEEIARKNLSHVLAKEDYDVATAADGEAALRELDAAEFDVVITDLKMGRIDGMELLDRVRVRHPDTRVIMVTGYATVPSAIEAVKKGAFDYIAKPFKLDEVRGAARRAMEKKVLRSNTKGSVLCFAGPPGTGKTSLGRSIARALGRTFTRIALGGLKDEADIRGHRRTYVGAKPGRVIEEIRRVESANPVIMLDELDKVGRDFKGDPASALLEVLDPEQNRTFVDHYLDVPFDLSSVMFIVTANVLDTIPDALRDRMEVIEFTGYTQEEKLQIASRFICPKQVREKGLSPTQVAFSNEAIAKIIQEYTREAGIRNLERRVATICRKIARESVDGKVAHGTMLVSPDAVERYLGRSKYHFEVIEERDRVGVATGLVRTESGGDIIFVEAAQMKGKKELIITGSLGDVMRESAQAALSYIRSNASVFGIPEDFFEHHDIHIHVPSGAIQKDGPSAGITILVALASLLTKRPARRDVAMTGEITLTGRILPVSGIQEKVLAARRARVRMVIVPARNRHDVAEMSDAAKKDIEVRLADTIQEVVDAVLLPDAEGGMRNAE